MNQIKYYKEVIKVLCDKTGIKDDAYVMMIQNSPKLYLECDKRAKLLKTPYSITNELKDWDTSQVTDFSTMTEK